MRAHEVYQLSSNEIDGVASRARPSERVRCGLLVRLPPSSHPPPKRETGKGLAASVPGEGDCSERSGVWIGEAASWCCRCRLCCRNNDFTISIPTRKRDTWPQGIHLEKHINVSKRGPESASANASGSFAGNVSRSRCGFCWVVQMRRPGVVRCCSLGQCVFYVGLLEATGQARDGCGMCYVASERPKLHVCGVKL